MKASRCQGSYLLYVADPDAMYRQALAAGATSIMPLTDEPYGRIGGIADVAGNQWVLLAARSSLADDAFLSPGGSNPPLGGNKVTEQEPFHHPPPKIPG